MKLNQKLFIVNIILIVGLVILQILDIITTYFLVPYTEFVSEGNPFMALYMDDHFFIVMFKIFPIVMFAVSNLCCYYLGSFDFNLGKKFLISTGFLLIITCIIMFYIVLNNLLVMVFLINTNQINIF